MDAGTDQDAHVACGFSISFYGYDTGTQTASISITPVAPTAGTHTYSTTTSWTTATRTGGSQWDANVPVTGGDLASTLAGVTAQPQQGYHLRLEVEVTGSRGSDDKYKVFWMQPCASTSPGGSSSSGGSSGSSGGSSGSSGGSTGSSGGSSNSSSNGSNTSANGTSTSASHGVTPASVAAATSPVASIARTSSVAETARAAAAARYAATSSAATSGSTPVSTARPAGSLAFTGVDAAGLAAAGFGLIGAGLMLTRRSRRAAPQA